MAARHLRAAISARRDSRSARRRMTSSTHRALTGNEPGGDKHVGGRPRNARTVNAPKGW